MTDGAQRQTKSNGTAAAPRNRRERGRPVQSTGTATKAGNRPPKASRPNAEATAPARKGGERTSGKNRTNQADKTKRQECLRHPAGHNPHRNGTNAMNEYHIPVLAEESIELLDIRPEGSYADLTFGGGGHSSLILSKLGSRGRLYAFDQDADAKANAERIHDDRFTFIESNFRFMRGQLRMRGVETLDGVFADLGVSSHHFDTPERGFSFRYDAPLDMRMNRRGGVSAADIVNGYDPERLTLLLGKWGELQTPYKIANCIERARTAKPIVTVSDLTEAVAPCTPKKDETKFLSKLFQALRIEVNGEMRALEMALEQSLKMLRPGGRLVIISYHSLEDRLVKNFMRSGTFSGEAEKDFFGNTASPFRPVTRKAVVPTEQEIKENPRSRSARLRAAEKKE